MKNAHEIIATIREDGAGELIDILYALEDGEALAFYGFTDADQEAIEEAHSLVRDQIEALT